MGNETYVGIAGVLASIVGSLVTWLVMKRQLANKKISYGYEIVPIVRSKDQALAEDLKIFYRGESVPQPALLHLAIENSGHTAIENCEVFIQLSDVALMPGYFVDIPPGYQNLWEICRTGPMECIIKFSHINPNQIVRLRLLMDRIPTVDPRISCPMPNVQCTESRYVGVGPLMRIAISVVDPSLVPKL